MEIEMSWEIKMNLFINKMGDGGKIKGYFINLLLRIIVKEIILK